MTMILRANVERACFADVWKENESDLKFELLFGPVYKSCETI